MQDRAGRALAEREHKNIAVYKPFLAESHDEKMFRVVKDQAGWFDVVMGRPTGTDERNTDTEEARIQLHPSISNALSMDVTSK